MSVYLELLLIGVGLYIVLIPIAIPSERYGSETEISLPWPIAFILFPPLALGKLRGYYSAAVFMQAGNLLFIIASGVLALLEHLGAALPKVVGKVLIIAFMAVMALSVIGLFLISYKKLTVHTDRRSDAEGDSDEGAEHLGRHRPYSDPIHSRLRVRLSYLHSIPCKRSFARAGDKTSETMELHALSAARIGKARILYAPCGIHSNRSLRLAGR